MCAARIDAAVSAVVQEHPRESQNGLKKLSITLWAEAMLSKRVRIPSLVPLPVFDLGTLAQQEVAREVLRLRTLVETVVSDEAFEDVVEPIQEGDPVEKIAPRKRPFRREGFEGLRKKEERCRDC